MFKLLGVKQPTYTKRKRLSDIVYSYLRQLKISKGQANAKLS